MEMKRKPATFGATPIRVVLPIGHPNFNGRGEEYFYDINEAEKFVRENWNGGELSARVYEGRYWTPIFMINGDGEIYASPRIAQLRANESTLSLGNISK
jgi:hypothetical protein